MYFWYYYVSHELPWVAWLHWTKLFLFSVKTLFKPLLNPFYSFNCPRPSYLHGSLHNWYVSDCHQWHHNKRNLFRPNKKLFGCLHRPLKLWKMFYYTKEYLPNFFEIPEKFCFSFFSKFKFNLNMSRNNCPHFSGLKN